MPDDERESPRAAIRSWLDRTERGPSTSRQTRPDVRHEQRQHDSKSRHHPTRQNPTRQTKGLERAAAIGNRQLDRRRDKNQASHSNSVQSNASMFDKVQHHSHVETHKIKLPGKSGLAEKLGLHAPFRAFKDRSGDEDADLDALSPPRKRKHCRSSTDSYLEPAEIHERMQLPREPSSPHEKARDEGNHRVRSHQFSERSMTTSPVREKAAKSYERRPRHKTREDRYELKEGKGDMKKKESKSKKESSKDKRKKHKRREKSGTALMHDFSAHNVSNDRLTLQPAKAFGLFSRGRASSPIRRRGLPDLTFSEMSFLNSRRPKPGEIVTQASSVPAETSKRRKVAKAADTEAEISRYFTSNKAPEQDPPDRRHQQTQPASRRRAQIRDSPPKFIDLPDTPFLGFGSCGASSLSPAKKPSSPAMRDLERRLTRSPTRSTSYLTWSQSEALSQGSLQREKHKILPLESSRLSNRKHSSPVPQKAVPPRSTLSPSCVEGVPLQKDRPEISSTPRGDVCSKSCHYKGRSPQSTVRHHGGAEQNTQNQGTDQTELGPARDRGRFIENNSQNVQALDLPNCNSASAPSGRLAANMDDCKGKSMLSPRASSLGLGQGATTLDDALEALLQDSRPTNRTFDANTKHVGHVGMEPLDRSHHCSRTSSAGHGAHRQAGINSTPRYPLPAAGTPTGYAVPYTNPDHDMELPRTQQSTHFSSRPVRDTPSGPSIRHYTPDLPCGPRSVRDDTTSAWNGYGNIYGRQDSGSIVLENQYDFLTGHGEKEDGDHRMPYDRLLASRQQSAVYDNHGTSAELYNRQGVSPLIDSGFEKQPGPADGAWDPTEENLFADHHLPYFADEIAYGHENNYNAHDHDTLREPQYQARLTAAPQRPAFLPFTPGINSTGRGFVQKNTDVLESLAETAPSKFWTPHKLY